MNLIDILPKNWILHRQVAMHIIQHKKLLFSYSGGIDSTVLLDILTTLKNMNNTHCNLMKHPLSLRVVHVHHGLHKHADMWVNHCKKQCIIRNIPFQVFYIKNFFSIKKNNQRWSNIEASARYLRYQALYNLLDEQEVLVTAHHMNDQIETFFLALKRGSGPNGLSGMNIDTFYFKNFRILRPLLRCSRLQLKQYAVNNNLSWIEDDMNNNIAFDRNFLRIKILPLLYDRWPSFHKVVLRTTELCRDQENLLDELLSESLNQLIDTDGSLYFEPLFQFSTIKRHAVLRRWIANFSANIPSYRFVHRMWQEVILSRRDANPILRLDQYLCRRFHKKLYLIPLSITFPLDTIKLCWTHLHNTMILPCNLGLLIFQALTFHKKYLHHESISNAYVVSISNIFFDIFKKFGKILTSCIIRSPRSDETVFIQFGNIDGLLHIVARDRGRKLKKIWQEHRIPPWLRSRIPLLFYNHVLISAIGVFITKAGEFDKTKNSALCQISWMQDASYYRFFKDSICNYLK